MMTEAEYMLVTNRLRITLAKEALGPVVCLPDPADSAKLAEDQKDPGHGRRKVVCHDQDEDMRITKRFAITFINLRSRGLTIISALAQAARHHFRTRKP